MTKKRINIEIRKELYEALTKAAKTDRVSVSEIIEVAIPIILEEREEFLKDSKNSNTCFVCFKNGVDHRWILPAK